MTEINCSLPSRSSLEVASLKQTNVPKLLLIWQMFPRQLLGWGCRFLVLLILPSSLLLLYNFGFLHLALWSMEYGRLIDLCGVSYGSNYSFHAGQPIFTRDLKSHLYYTMYYVFICFKSPFLKFVLLVHVFTPVPLPYCFNCCSYLV